MENQIDEYSAQAEGLNASDEQQISASEALMQIAQMDNIAAELEGVEGDISLDNIAERVIKEYEIDKKSREEWEETNKEALKMAMLVSEKKDYPFEDASNIKYPLITVGALQFNARAYPAIIQGNRVAKCVTWGEDANGEKVRRADRVSEHLSYQLLSEMPEWEADTDRMLIMLPILGCMIRKVYFDPSLGRKCTRLLPPQNLVVNYFARSLEDTPRATEEMPLYPYEIQERIRSGRFIEFDYGTDTGMDEETGQSKEHDDTSEPHMFLEQHRLLDLDGDGYPEPYIVTVHKSLKKVCRIVANFDGKSLKVTEDGKISAIRKTEYYIKYDFMPSPDGSFYGWGFGSLLKDLGESINSTLNQMMDAGHLSNVQGGLVSASMGIREKSISLKNGEWKVIKTNMPMNQAVFPIKYDGPSPVLFQLLGLLIEAGKDISATKDIMTGEVNRTMTAAATMALIEQGMQVFTSIFKRIHRSLKAELRLHSQINASGVVTPEDYNELFDGQEQYDPAQDYEMAGKDITPVSDANVASRMQELGKAQFIAELAKENPHINQIEATKRQLEAAQIEGIDELIVQPPPPDPEMEMMGKLAAMLELEDKKADVMTKYTAAMKDISDADSGTGEGERPDALSRARLMLQIMESELETEIEQGMIESEEAKENGQGRLSDMAGQPGNEMGAAPVGPQGPADGGPVSGIPA
jgi:chaperonin GroES